MNLLELYVLTYNLFSVRLTITSYAQYTYIYNNDLWIVGLYVLEGMDVWKYSIW